MNLPLLLGAVTVLILGILGTPLLQVFLALRPYRVEFDNRPEDYKMEYRDIEFEGAGGVKLKGWYIPAEEETEKTVIVCHGHGFNRGKVLHKVAYLQKKYNLFLYDLRYFGKSEGEHTTLGFLEKEDLRKAAEFIKQETETEKLAFYGFSLSAATVLMADTEEAEAVIADSPFTSLEALSERIYMYLPGKTKKPMLGLVDRYMGRYFDLDMDSINPLENARNMDRPVLLIHGTEDFQIPCSHSEHLHKEIENSELYRVEGATHVRSYEKDPEKYQKKVQEFLEKNL